jgi:hypothetical protein
MTGDIDVIEHPRLDRDSHAFCILLVIQFLTIPSFAPLTHSI